MGSRTWILAAVLALAACSSEKKLPQVHASYEAPNGFSFVGEQGGPPPRATFAPGLSLTRFSKPLPSGDADAVAAALPELAGLGGGWAVLNARAGTLPVGPVVRVELQKGSDRALHYVIPRAQGFLDLAFTAPESSYGPLEAKVEMSLSHLKAEP